jgi:hypothetical protein
MFKTPDGSAGRLRIRLSFIAFGDAANFAGAFVTIPILYSYLHPSNIDS